MKKLIPLLLSLFLLSACGIPIENRLLRAEASCTTRDGYILVEPAGEYQFHLNYYSHSGDRLPLLDFPKDQPWRAEYTPLSFDGEAFAFSTFSVGDHRGGGPFETCFFRASRDSLVLHDYQLDMEDGTVLTQDDCAADPNLRGLMANTVRGQLGGARQLLRKVYTPDQAAIVFENYEAQLAVYPLLRFPELLPAPETLRVEADTIVKILVGNSATGVFTDVESADDRAAILAMINEAEAVATHIAAPEPWHYCIELYTGPAGPYVRYDVAPSRLIRHQRADQGDIPYHATRELPLLSWLEARY